MAFSREARPTFHQIGIRLEELDSALQNTTTIGSTAEDYPLYIL